MPMLLADAIALAAEAHRGQADKAGEAYILHPLRVMFRVRDQGHRVEVQAAAVLHDVVEDTSVTLEDIAALSPEVAALVDAVTRRHGEVYESFIRRAAENPEARSIKTADVEDNLARIGLLAQLAPEQAERLGARYRRALALLLEPPLRS
jgi:(p)ppGpp synthase/HD superfamily hydrolase